MPTKLDLSNFNFLLSIHNLQPAGTVYFPDAVCISKLGLTLCRQFNELFPNFLTKITLDVCDREMLRLSWCYGKADILLGVILRDRLDKQKWDLALIPEILNAEGDNPYRPFSVLPKVINRIGNSF